MIWFLLVCSVSSVLLSWWSGFYEYRGWKVKLAQFAFDFFLWPLQLLFWLIVTIWRVCDFILEKIWNS